MPIKLKEKEEVEKAGLPPQYNPCQAWQILQKNKHND